MDTPETAASEPALPSAEPVPAPSVAVTAAAPAAASAPPAPLPGAEAAHPSLRVAQLALVLAALGLIAALYVLRQDGLRSARLEQLQAQVQAAESRDAEREHRLTELEHQWAQAQGDADVAAGQITDAELRRRREQLALIDVERVVEQAQLQLRLGVSAGAAIDALDVVDARLGRLGSPRALRVQSALRHDLARLRAAPDVDRGALAARLDPLLAAVDTWHPSADAAHTSLHQPPATRPNPAAHDTDSTGARLRAWIAREFGDLLRIREVETPEALLLGPTQQQLLRDRVRLGLVDLREAILARDERTIRAEAAALDLLLQRYFDPAQPGVGAALGQLRATLAAAVPAAAPTLDETLSALRAAALPGA